ncbi:MAG: hypothetical protein RL129_1390 [Actinomycetota bacterium]
MSITDGQRVEKAHPLGISIGLGTSPCSATRSSFAFGFMLGTAESKAIVYGCSAASGNDSAGRISTTTMTYISGNRYIVSYEDKGKSGFALNLKKQVNNLCLNRNIQR